MEAAEKETKLMRRHYPSARITPEDVVEFSRAQGQQPSIEDAERWLSRQKRCIEGMMGDVVHDNLDKIFGEATLTAYPDPVFDKQFKAIDEAIVTASDAFCKKIDEEPYGCSYQERDMCKVVRRMLVEQDKFVACLAYSQDFGELGKSYDERVIGHHTKRVHLSCTRGKVTAEVVIDDACEHGQDVFVPDERVGSPPAGRGPKAGVKGGHREL
jgi:hypothetical protein